MKIFSYFILLISLLAPIQSNAQSFHANPFPQVDEAIVSGTTGTPLGGFGTGSIKFNANTGTFAIATRPPIDAFDYVAVPEARFELVVTRGGKTDTTSRLCALKKDGLSQDDALFPLHRVPFACHTGISAQMTGFAALDPAFPENMLLPIACFEIHLENTGRKTAEVSFSLFWKWEEDYTEISGAGIQNRFSSVQAMFDGGKASISGEALAGGLGRTCIRARLASGESRTLKFVVSWYDRTDPELAQYKAVYENPSAIAKRGLNVFDRLKQNALDLVTRMQASNLPDWFENQTLNTLANLVTNSMYKKDGRVAFAEGQWTCFGTMDQMWLARMFVSQYMPGFAWKELEYWARTQMKNGQIHHDFNKMDAPNNALRSALVPWDDTEHKDYRNIQKWVDLNAAFIISVYETYRLSGHFEKFKELWPNVKKATMRIFDQLDQYEDPTFPGTFRKTENSYDAGGEPDPYNTSLTAVTLRILSETAPVMGDTALGLRCRNTLDTLINSFRNRYLQDESFKLSKHCESYFAGQWLAYHLNLGELWTAGETDWVLDRLNGYYQPFQKGLGYEKGTYDEWTPYLLTHYGGLLLLTGQPDAWLVLQRDSYLRQYLNRDKVFNHPLNILPLVTTPKLTATSFSSDKQYISMPAQWRNYSDVVGFQRDAASQDIWLKPILPAAWGDRMENALFLSEKGFGSLTYSENKAKPVFRTFYLKSEEPLQVNRIHLRDDFGDSVVVQVNGKALPFTRTGSGYARELVVLWKNQVTNAGMTITVSGNPREKINKTSSYVELPAAKTGLSVKKVRSAFQPLEAEDADAMGGVEFDGYADTRQYAKSLDNFDYLEFSEVDFGSQAATSFTACIKDLTADCMIEVMLDGVAGELIGTCPLKESKEVGWRNLTCPIRPTLGRHTVTLRFVTQDTSNTMKLDHVLFNAK